MTGQYRGGSLQATDATEETLIAEETTAEQRYAALFAADEAAELAAQRDSAQWDDSGWLLQDPYQEELLRRKSSPYSELTMVRNLCNTSLFRLQKDKTIRQNGQI